MSLGEISVTVNEYSYLEDPCIVVGQIYPCACNSLRPVGRIQIFLEFRLATKRFLNVVSVFIQH